jgi:peptidoglycan hydrolase CwlO-like protein
MEVITLLLTQCPVLGALIWFIVITTRESNQRFKEQAEQFQTALDKVVDKLGNKVERMDSKIVQVGSKIDSLEKRIIENENENRIHPAVHQHVKDE